MFKENPNCKLRIKFEYDMIGYDRNLTLTSNEFESTYYSAGQKLRVMADEVLLGFGEIWDEMLDESRKIVNRRRNYEEESKEERDIKVFIIADNVQLAHTKSKCLPCDFPQCLHELILRLAQGLDTLCFDISKKDYDKLESGNEVRKDDMRIFGVHLGDEEKLK